MILALALAAVFLVVLWAYVAHLDYVEGGDQIDREEVR